MISGPGGNYCLIRICDEADLGCADHICLNTALSIDAFVFCCCYSLFFFFFFFLQNIGLERKPVSPLETV